MAFSMNAQDPGFSQNQNTGSYLNPALSGMYNGSMRAGVNYRDQWGSVLGAQKFLTGNVNGDVKFRIFGDDYFSVNGNAMFDQAGAGRYSQVLLHLGGSYIKKLSENYDGGQFLSFGFRAGVGQNSLDFGKLWFDNQFDRGGLFVNTEADNGEPNINGGISKTNFYPDMGVGLFWHMIRGDNSSLYAGIAANHLNQPTISLLESSSAGIGLYTKWSGNVGAELPLNTSISVMPSFLMWVQGPSWQTMFGSAIKYNSYGDGDISMRLGMMARLSSSDNSSTTFDSFVIDVGFEFSKYTIGLSYDITVSQFALANKNRGAFELSLLYTRSEENSYRRSTTNFPSF